MNPEDETDALSRESADRKGSTNAPAATGRSMTTVCTRAIQTPTEPVHPGTRGRPKQL